MFAYSALHCGLAFLKVFAHVWASLFFFFFFYKSRNPKGTGEEKGQGQRGSDGDRRSISLSDSVVIVWSYNGERAAAPGFGYCLLRFPPGLLLLGELSLQVSPPLSLRLSLCLSFSRKINTPPPRHDTRKAVHSNSKRKQSGQARRQRFTAIDFEFAMCYSIVR